MKKQILQKRFNFLGNVCVFFIITFFGASFLYGQTIEQVLNYSQILFQNNDHKPVIFNNKAFFKESIGTYTTDGTGGYARLAYTNGTKQESGVFKVKYNPAFQGKTEDYLELPFDNPQYNNNNFIAFLTDKYMFFMASKGSFSQTDFSFWRSDGTAEGTVELSTKINRIFEAIAVGDLLYFTGTEDKKSVNLYVSDGSITGTKLIRKNVSNIYSFEDNVFFLGHENENELSSDLAFSWNCFYEIKKENSANRLLKVDYQVFNSVLKIQDKERIVLTTNDKKDSNKRVLLLINLKDKSILKLLEFFSNLNDSSLGATILGDFIKLQNRYSFTKSILKFKEGNSGEILTETSLVSYDLDFKNYKVEIPVFKPSVSGLGQFFLLNQKLYFEGSEKIDVYSHPRYLWESDGTLNGTKRIIRLKRVTGVPDGQKRVNSSYPMVINNKAYFYGDSTYSIKIGGNSQQNVNKYFLYRTDGTKEGTIIISDSLAQPSNLLPFENKIYFTDWNYIYETAGSMSSSKKVIRLLTSDEISEETDNPIFDKPTLSDEIAVQMGTLNLVNNKIVFPIQSNHKIRYVSFDPKGKPQICNVGVFPLSKYYTGFFQESNFKLCTGEINDLVVPFITYPQSSLRWYKDGKVINDIFKTLPISQDGTYRLEAEYMGCLASSKEITIKIDGPKVLLSKVKVSSTPSSSEEWLNLKVTNGYYINNPDSYSITLNFNDKLLSYINESRLNFVNGKNVYKPNLTDKGIFSVNVVDLNKCVGTSSLDWTNSQSTGGGNNSGSGGSGSSQVISTITSSATEVYSPNTIKLSASTGTGYTYQWQKDGKDILGATAATFDAKESGTYRVIVSLNGVSKTSNEIVITIKTVLANEPFIGSGITIYPNPTSEFVTIKMNNFDGKSSKIKVYSSLGKLVREMETVKSEQTLEVKNLSSDIYLIKVTQGKNTYSSKLIKL
ncbi:MAG: T9SS type A sorting domain-containing protein [Spirosomataceae bacterium]|jgi:hypothetical protein